MLFGIAMVSGNLVFTHLFFNSMKKVGSGNTLKICFQLSSCSSVSTIIQSSKTEHKRGPEISEFLTNGKRILPQLFQRLLYCGHVSVMKNVVVHCEQRRRLIAFFLLLREKSAFLV